MPYAMQNYVLILGQVNTRAHLHDWSCLKLLLHAGDCALPHLAKLEGPRSTSDSVGLHSPKNQRRQHC